MGLTMNLDDFNLNKNDRIYLILLLLFSSISTLSMLNFTLSGWISNPDIALYLLSGLKYAGLDTFNVVYPQDLYFTPVISFLTSLIFRLGYVDKNAIIIVTATFCFLGYMGLYLLLRNRFSSLISLTGVVIYGCLPLIIINSARGMIDLPAVSISIWVLEFAIISIDRNPKYFLLTFPLLVVAFFTKYTAGFILPIIILYYVMQRDIVDLFDSILYSRNHLKQKANDYIHSMEFRYIAISLTISLILAIIICKTLILDFGGTLGFFGKTASTIDNSITSGIDYNMDKSYYFDTFPYILFRMNRFGSILCGLLYAVFGIGLVINIARFITGIKEIRTEKRQFKTKHLEKALLFISIVLLIVSFFAFKSISNHLISNVSLLMALTIIFSILNRYDKIDKTRLALDMLFLAYFSINFIFISLFAIKVPRYSLQVMPAFIYLVVWGLDSLTGYLDEKITSNRNVVNFLPIVLIIVFALFAVSVNLAPMDYADSDEIYFDMFVYDSNGIYLDVYENDFDWDLVEACEYIINSNPDYHDSSFASFYHHSKMIRWYMNVNITIAENDDTLSDFNQTDYIILNENKTLPNYDNVFHNDGFYVYCQK